MKQKQTIIIALGIVTIAMILFFIKQKKNGPSPENTSTQEFPTRLYQRQEDNHASHSEDERQQRAKRAQTEKDKLITLWTNNASAGFALAKKHLIADLNLNAGETAEVDQIFARRETQLVGLLNSNAPDDREVLKKICALLRNKGLREELASILSPEKLATFDANEAARARETIEARAYRDMADLNSIVTLSDTQKQQVLAALIKNAPSKVEQEADARAFMTLNYGQALTDIDSSSIRGLANMVSASMKNEMPDASIESSHYELWTQTNKSERIKSEINALQQILDEKQLSRYRKHLEAEPAW